MKYSIKILEILGIAVIVLVLLAVLTTSAIVASTPSEIIKTSAVLSVLIAILVTTSIIRLLGKTNYQWLTILGFTLVIAGMATAFLVPEYFQEMIHLPVPFWYKVSWYTLPAIVIEGGILTLFVVLTEKGLLSRFLPRERALISCTFILYAAATVAMNFLVLDTQLTVASHIQWTRIVLLIVTTISIIIGLQKILSQKR